ncbi:MAG TPA: hypothetical protein VFN67_29880 [Polyangiales bacterium]|nr:hypothetical protein [Polyangiales bacterium]
MPRSDAKRAGRPRGSSKKLEAVRDLIAAGTEPLEAFARAGYTDPYRARQHHAAQIAEVAVGADPRATLENIATFGRPEDKVRACRDLLELFADERPKQAAAPIVSGVEDAREMTAEQREQLKAIGKPIYTLPAQLVPAMQAWDALCVGGTDVEDAPCETRCNPIRILEDLIVKGQCRDEVLRQTAVTLIKRNAAKPVGDDETQWVFCVPSNGRVPFDVAIAAAVVVTAQAGTDARALLFDALEQRDQSNN